MLTSASVDLREADAFRRGLPENVLAVLDHADSDDMPAAVERNGSGYCLVEAPDGEFPQLRTFHTVEGLVQRLTNLVGQDVVAFPFFGTPLPISKGPNRFLLLPNDQAVSITKHQQRVDLAEEDVTIEDSGFLGLPALGIPAPDYYEPEDEEDTPHRGNLPINDFDDEDDDEPPEPAS